MPDVVDGDVSCCVYWNLIYTQPVLHIMSVSNTRSIRRHPFLHELDSYTHACFTATLMHSMPRLQLRPSPSVGLPTRPPLHILQSVRAADQLRMRSADALGEIAALQVHMQVCGGGCGIPRRVRAECVWKWYQLRIGMCSVCDT
jgi:hypothetical protein